MSAPELPEKVRRAVDEIAADSVLGASHLAVRSLEALALCGRESAGLAPDSFRERLVLAARSLCLAQPAMHAIRNRVCALLDSLFEPGAVQAETSALIGRLESIVRDCLAADSRELVTLGESGARHLAGRLAPGVRIVTLSASRAAFEVLSRLTHLGVEIAVAESRPLNEGVEFAGQLAAAGLEVRLVTDAMLGLETRGAALALSGADSLFPGGDILNKAGTRLLALAARADSVPFFCCTQTVKIAAVDWADETDCQAERPASEILAAPIESVKVRNLYFDRTEGPLIAGYITERGVLAREDIAALARKFENVHRRVFGA